MRSVSQLSWPHRRHTACVLESKYRPCHLLPVRPLFFPWGELWIRYRHHPTFFLLVLMSIIIYNNPYFPLLASLSKSLIIRTPYSWLFAVYWGLLPKTVTRESVNSGLWTTGLDHSNLLPPRLLSFICLFLFPAYSWTFAVLSELGIACWIFPECRAGASRYTYKASLRIHYDLDYGSR